MSEVGRSIDGIHDPLIFTGPGVKTAFFRQDGMLGEFLLQGGNDHLFRTLVKFRNEVNRAFLPHLAYMAEPLHDDGPGPAGYGFCDRQNI